MHIALGLGSCLEHAVVTVHGAKINVMMSQLPDRCGNGRRDVEQLQVSKYFLALALEFGHEFKIVTGQKNFQAQFVELDRVAQF